MEPAIEIITENAVFSVRETWDHKVYVSSNTDGSLLASRGHKACFAWAEVQEIEGDLHFYAHELDEDDAPWMFTAHLLAVVRTVDSHERFIGGGCGAFTDHRPMPRSEWGTLRWGAHPWSSMKETALVG